MSTQRKRLPASLYASDEIAPEAVLRLREFLDREVPDKDCDVN